MTANVIFECANGHTGLKRNCFCGLTAELKNLSPKGVMGNPITKDAPSKMGNKKVVIDNIQFDSTIEGARYLHLLAMEMLGEIRHLVSQHPLALRGASGGKIGLYWADFAYSEPTSTVFKWDDAERVFEDVKGRRLTTFNAKQKNLLAQGIEIKIVTREDIPKEFIDLVVEIRESGLPYEARKRK